MEAPLGAEYMLILTPGGDAIAAYLADAWEVAPELYQRCVFPADLHNEKLKKDMETPQDTSQNGMSKNSNIALNLALLAVHILAWFLPVVFAVFYLPVTTFFATKSAVRKQGFLSVLSVVSGFVTILFASAFLIYGK